MTQASSRSTSAPGAERWLRSRTRTGTSATTSDGRTPSASAAGRSSSSEVGAGAAEPWKIEPADKYGEAFYADCSLCPHRSPKKKSLRKADAVAADHARDKHGWVR